MTPAAVLVRYTPDEWKKIAAAMEKGESNAGVVKRLSLGKSPPKTGADFPLLLEQQRKDFECVVDERLAQQRKDFADALRAVMARVDGAERRFQEAATW